MNRNLGETEELAKNKEDEIIDKNELLWKARQEVEGLKQKIKSLDIINEREVEEVKNKM